MKIYLKIIARATVERKPPVGGCPQIWAILPHCGAIGPASALQGSPWKLLGNCRGRSRPHAKTSGWAITALLAAPINQGGKSTYRGVAWVFDVGPLCHGGAIFGALGPVGRLPATGSAQGAPRHAPQRRARREQGEGLHHLVPISRIRMPAPFLILKRSCGSAGLLCSWAPSLLWQSTFQYKIWKICVQLLLHLQIEKSAFYTHYYTTKISHTKYITFLLSK